MQKVLKPKNPRARGPKGHLTEATVMFCTVVPKLTNLLTTDSFGKEDTWANARPCKRPQVSQLKVPL